MSARRHVSVVLAATLGLFACNAVLGIEPAEIDPAAGDAAPTGAVTACSDYCTKIAKTCVGANKQYTAPDVCLAMCANLEPGAAGAVSGNSLACRLTHVGLAVNDPVTHCPHAGPLGTGTCGTSCESFCLQDVALCRAPNPRPYLDQGDCLTQCNAGASGSFRFVSGTSVDDEGIQSTDSLNCRIYHLERAYEPTLASEHCPHTARVSTKCVGASVDAGVTDAKGGG